MDWDWTLSDDAVGVILLGFAAVSLVIGAVLAYRGLASVDKAAHEASEAAKATKQAAAQTQTTLAGASGASADELATANQELVAKVASVDSAIGEVTTALGELKGVFTPTRAFLAFALLSFLASLVAFDVISLDLSAGTGGTTTTETTQTTP